MRSPVKRDVGELTRPPTAAPTPIIGEPCPLCSGTAFSPRASLRDNRTGAFEGRFLVARCTCCGLFGLRPLPDETDLASGYERGYGPYELPQVLPLTPPSSRVAALQDRLRRYWHLVDGNATIDRLPMVGRVLDVGAGQGENVAWLRDRGHDVVGLEPNPRAVEICRARGLPVIQGSLESAELETESFDTVLLSQVIEHLTDPVASLGVVRRLLRPGGRVVLLTPNVEGFPARLFGLEWAHWHVPYHVYLYGPGQLRRLLIASGFGVARLHTVTPGYWLGMSFRLKRRRSQETGWTLPHDDWRVHPAARVAVAPVVRSLDLLGRGDCLIAVGVK